MVVNGHKRGFRFSDDAALLTFAGTRYEGAEVRVRLNVPLKTYLAIQRAANSGDPLAAFEPFADVLLSWNLEDGEGAPIPATYEGMIEAPPDFLNHLVTGFLREVQELPAPLPETSGATATSGARNRGS